MQNLIVHVLKKIIYQSLDECISLAINKYNNTIFFKKVL